MLFKKGKWRLHSPLVEKKKPPLLEVLEISVLFYFYASACKAILTNLVQLYILSAPIRNLSHEAVYRTDFSKEELERFFACIFYFCKHGGSSITDFWSEMEDNQNCYQFSKGLLSRERFKLLYNCLFIGKYVSNSNGEVVMMDDDEKLDELFDMMNDLFSGFVNPSNYVCIDESVSINC